MGTMGIVTAVMATSLAAGTSPEPVLHAHPTIVSMLDENNELRATVGLSNHSISPELTKAAQGHARYMASTHNFDHYVNGTPQGRADAEGYRGSVLENIAMGYVTVEQAFTGWRYSSGHWAAITSGTSEAGFGYAVAEDGTGYWVGMYGYPAEASDDDTSETEVATAPAATYQYNYYPSRRRILFRRRR